MSKRYAKEHSLDIPHHSCIEFPLKVNNVEKALNLVGGKETIIRSVQDDTSNPLELRLTKSAYEHPINAKSTDHEQILLKISVPKSEYLKNDGNIQKTLYALHQKHSSPVHIQPISIVNKTFRFREMADFQYQTKNSDFSNTIENSIHSLNYQNIKNLEFEDDLKPWEPEAKALNGEVYYDLPPPPRFSSIPLPFLYHYKKNSATVVREGKLTVKKKNAKIYSIILKWGDSIPMTASDQAIKQLELFESEKKENILYADILKTLSIVKKLFELKPIWIRKHIESNLPPALKASLKYALPQVAYTYTKGPWRLAYIKYGVDPTSSKDYAKYQTEAFRVTSIRPNVPKDFISEVQNGVSKVFKFTGYELPSSLLFQIENLVDSQIQTLLSNAEIRDTADFYDGWYDSLTMFRLRRLVRYKLGALAEGSIIEEEKVDHLMNQLQLYGSSKDEDQEDNEFEDEIDEEEDEDNEDNDLNTQEANYEEILKYMEKINSKGAEELRKLTNIIKQNDIDI